jgi:hypothetical protein
VLLLLLLMMIMMLMMMMKMMMQSLMLELICVEWVMGGLRRAVQRASCC